MSIDKVLSSLVAMNESAKVKAEEKKVEDQKILDKDALMKVLEGYVGKKYAIEEKFTTDTEEMPTGKVLNVKSVVNEELEIEVCESDGTVVGIMRADEKSFKDLLGTGKIKETNEQFHNEAPKGTKEVHETVKIMRRARVVMESENPLEKQNSDEFNYSWQFDDIGQAEEFIALAKDMAPDAALVGPFEDSNDGSITVAYAGEDETLADTIDGIIDMMFAEEDDATNESFVIEETMIRVVRHGKVVSIPVKRKKRLSSARRMALKKNLKQARKFAHKGGADRQRAKSMKVRSRALGASFDVTESAMLEAFQDEFADNGIKILGGGFEVTNEFTNLEVQIEDSSEDITLNIDTLEKNLRESLGIEDIQIVDPARARVNGQRVYVINALVRK